MLDAVIKRFVAYLPESWQIELRRFHYARAIRSSRFLPDEPEDKILESLVTLGDCVIDVGANIGHYSKRFSDIVGPAGRVISIEPIPATFSLLSANASLFKNSNITLINAAASDSVDIVSFSIPTLPSGLNNYYMAQIDAANGSIRVLSAPIDSLPIPKRVSLVKIDVEGHELATLNGMKRLIEKDKPVLIVETRSKEVVEFVKRYGYSSERLQNSPNVIFTPDTNLTIGR